MSEELFFQNDDDDEFIQGWLKDTKSDNNVKGDEEEDLGMATEVRLGNDARNKFGLGFETSGSKGSVLAQKEHNDALMDRIKKRKLAAKEDRKNANKYADEHGVIEDELEGRAAVTSKSSKVQKISAAAAAGGKKAAKTKNKDSTSVSASASTSTNNNINNTTNGNTKSSNNSITNNNNNNSGNNNNKNNNSNTSGNNKYQNQNKNQAAGSGNNGDGNGDGDGEKPFIKRKRPKTRSKQKNIRRDKRDSEFMPEHLKVGSDKYTGRPLTEETKKYMGIAK